MNIIDKNSMLINSNDYFDSLEEIKSRIKKAQYRVVLSANRELIELNWQIGRIIIANTRYGAKFIENLAKDIKQEFPNITGYSPRNLKYMRKFAEIVNDEEKMHTVCALLSWSHNRRIIDKAKTLNEYLWYAEKVVENTWSVSSLEYHLDTKAYQRQELPLKTTNYERLLPISFANQAIEVLKDPYIFDFVEQREGIIEREIENELVANIAKTIMELGVGFAFVGHQYHLEIAEKDYYIDLLFYNTKLRCYVVIELKNTDFMPEYAGKLNFYLSAVDDILKHETDNPSIGIMLCKTKNRLTAEYALKDINKPIGVSEYKLSDFVPAEFADTLPSAEDIEKRVRMKFDINTEIEK